MNFYTIKEYIEKVLNSKLYTNLTIVLDDGTQMSYSKHELYNYKFFDDAFCFSESAFESDSVVALWLE